MAVNKYYTKAEVLMAAAAILEAELEHLRSAKQRASVRGAKRVLLSTAKRHSAVHG